MTAKVFLVAFDPHPEHGNSPPAIEAWFGKEIEIGAPIIPANPMPCGTHTLWPIVGPPAFIHLLGRYGRHKRYVCIHLIDQEGASRGLQASQSPLEHRHG